MNKFKLTPKLIKIIFGAVCILVAVVVTLSVMLTSYTDWKKYYDSVMAEKAMQKLPLELLGIEARLADGVIYYDNDTAEPEATDFEVTANFTEKGRNFSKGLSADDYAFEVPEEFSLYGGKIVFTYEWQPEKTGETEPEPVIKTAELNITLVQPDATVYKMTQVPTYTQVGTAENIEGDIKVLPVLDDVSYTYNEYPKTGIAKFVYEELGITIKKNLTDEMSIETADGTKADVNNVNCHFTANLSNAALSYDDENKSFVLTVNEGEQLTIGRIDVKNFTIGGGTVTMNTKLKLQSLIVKSGAAFKMSGVNEAIEASHLLFEDGSDVTIETTNDGILLYGDAEFYGNLNITRTSGYGGTAVYIQESKLDITFSETSRVVITNYSFTMATFSDDEKDLVVYFPYGSEKETTGSGHSTTTCWYLQGDERTEIVKFANSEYPFYGVAEKMQNRGGYVVTKNPTLIETGLAVAEGKEDIVLPVLSLDDYEIEEKANGETAFTFLDKGIAFYEIIDGERITIDGVTYNKVTVNLASFENASISYADGVYTVTVAVGDVAELGYISGEALVIGGEGTLKLTGSEGITLKTIDLTVKSGALLEIPNANIGIDAEKILFEAGSTVTCKSVNDGIYLRGNAEFYGTLNAARLNAYGGTGIYFLESKLLIEFADTSRVTFTDYQYTIGSWNGSTDVILALPYGTQKETTGSGQATVTCWYLQGDERTEIVKFANSEIPLANGATDQTASRDGYIITKMPTETEDGLAVAEGKEDIVLPALNATDYTVEEQADGRFAYTHKATGLIVYVSIDGERITIDGTEYNRVTVNELATDDVTFSYAGGVYTVTVAAGKTVEFVSINCKVLVIDGEGTLKLTGSKDTTLNADDLTVKSGASLEILNASEAIRSGKILFEAGSTVTCAASGDGIVLFGNAKLYGTFNLTRLGEKGGTGISTLNSDYNIEFADTSRATFTDYQFAIASWNGSERVNVTVPVGTQKREENGTQWYLGGETIVSFVNADVITHNIGNPLG